MKIVVWFLLCPTSIHYTHSICYYLISIYHNADGALFLQLQEKWMCYFYWSAGNDTRPPQMSATNPGYCQFSNVSSKRKCFPQEVMLDVFILRAVCRSIFTTIQYLFPLVRGSSMSDEWGSSVFFPEKSRVFYLHAGIFNSMRHCSFKNTELVKYWDWGLES